MAQGQGQQHPLAIYFWIWALLFVFSAFSYLVDILDFQGMLRWSLIIIFMLLKAGFIVAIFMHMAWERLALIYAILGPPVVLLVLIGLMAVEGDYTEVTRITFFGDLFSDAAPAGEGARVVDADCRDDRRQPEAVTMLALLIAVAVLSVLWLALWRSQPLMAFGVFIGLPIGWLAYRTFSPYFTGDMDDIPVWLPPLPVVTIALALIVYGAIVWFRGEKLGREKKQD